MTEDQDRHLTEIIYFIANHYRPRYERGAREYGDNMWEHDEDWFIDNAIEENLDALAYLISWKLKRDKDGRDVS